MRQRLARTTRCALVFVFLAGLAPVGATAGPWQAFSNANQLTSVSALDPYVWMPSNQGVNRYDPRTGAFTYYFHDPGALASNLVTAVARDPDSTIWFGTQDQGASLFAKDGSWREVGLFQGLLGLHVTTLEPYQVGMWVGTDQGLAFFIGDKLQDIWPDGTHPSPFLSPSIRDIAVSSSRTWVATANGVYTTTAGVSWDSLTANLPTRDVRSLAYDGSTLWAVDSTGAVWSGGDTGTWTSRPGSGVRVAARAGQVYLASASGVGQWDPVGGAWTPLGGPPRASLDVALDGTLWAGNGQGLWRWNGSAWATYEAPGPVNNWVYGLTTQGNTIYATCRDQNPSLGGMSRYDTARGWRTFLNGPDTDTSFVSHDFLIMAGTDRQSYKWFADWDGSIARLDDSGPVPQFTHFCRDTSRFTYGWAFGADPQGPIWIGLDTNCAGCGPAYDPLGLLRIDPDGTRNDFIPMNSAMSGDQVRAITFAPDGTMWVGYRDFGVDLFTDRNLQSRATHIGKLQGLSSDNVWGVAITGSTAWVLTDGGLTEYTISGSQVQYVRTTLTPAMSSLGATHPLVIDGQGGAWVASKLGLYHVKPDGTTEIFTEDNSPLLSNDLHALVLDASGGLWIGSVSGLNRLDLSGLSVGATTQSLVVTPNPLRASGGATTAFRLVTAEGVAYARSPLQIRDARGRLVAELRTDAHGNTSWNGNDINGRRCPGGVYFVRVVQYGYAGAPEPLAQARLVLLP
jgi:ligand-binding sensor domain-containing protein